MPIRVALLAAVVSILFPSWSTAHVDGMTLRASRGPNQDDVRLEWTGGQPMFQVYRSTLPTDVLSSQNFIGESDERTWLDAPPSATIFFYQVASPCPYNPPEICDGLDNDCDGVVDGPGSELSCNLPHATPTCSAGSCAIASCDAGFGDCDTSPVDGCESDLATDPAHCGGCSSSCDDFTGCTEDICVASTCRHVDRSLCVAAPETDPDACGVHGCDVCSFAMSMSEPGCNVPDSDGDGLADPWEDAGAIDLDCNGVLDSNDVVLPGAHKRVKDVYLKISAMQNAPDETYPGLHIPTSDAIEPIVAAFAASHLTTTPVPCDGSPTGNCPPGFVCSAADFVCLPACTTDSQCTTGSCVDGACRLRRLHVDPEINLIPHAKVLFFGPVQPACITGGDPAQGVNFYDLKLDPANFNPKTALFKRYGVFGHFNSCDSTETCSDSACAAAGGGTSAPSHSTSGLAEMSGNDFVVTLGDHLFVDASEKIRSEAGTLMHELGHTLGLHHGGPDCDPTTDPSCIYAPTQDRKVNYISVMNHLYGSGIPVADVAGSTVPSSTLPPRFDYSRSALPTLHEPCLDEFLGVQPGNPPFTTDLVMYFCPGSPLLARFGSTAPGQPIDWNCNGRIETCVPVNINNDPPGALPEETHAGAEDWGRLRFQFECGATFEDGAKLDY